MPKHSAGILLYRLGEVLLMHPDGPFWTNKDLDPWSIPKENTRRSKTRSQSP